MKPQKTIWGKIFQEHGTYFEDPHEDMPKVKSELAKIHARRVLDVGCGSGRHTVYLAQQGFEVYGLDNSEEGIGLTKKWLDDQGLHAHLTVHEMTDPLPWSDRYFDAVISVQVIHHAKISDIQKVVEEIERVLKTSGYIFITVPRLKNQATNYKEIEPRTFVPLDGIEKGLPHHFFTQEELFQLFSHFDITIHEDSHHHFCASGNKVKESVEL